MIDSEPEKNDSDFQEEIINHARLFSHQLSEFVFFFYVYLSYRCESMINPNLFLCYIMGKMNIVTHLNCLHFEPESKVQHTISLLYFY